MSRTRYTHQVTAASLHILMMEAYESYTKSIEASSSFLCWNKQKVKEYPQFHYWSATLNFQFTILMFVRSIRSWDFGLYISSIQKLAVMLVGCRYIFVIWYLYKRHTWILQHTFTKASFLFRGQKRFSHRLGMIMHMSKTISAPKVMEIRISIFIIVQV